MALRLSAANWASLPVSMYCSCHLKMFATFLRRSCTSYLRLDFSFPWILWLCKCKYVNATDVMPSNLPRVSRVFVTCASIVLVGASLPKWSYLFPWRHLCFLCFRLGCFAVSCLTASSRVSRVLWHTGGALNRWFYVESVSFLARFCLRCRFHAVLLLLLAQSVVFSGFCIRDWITFSVLSFP